MAGTDKTLGEMGQKISRNLILGRERISRFNKTAALQAFASAWDKMKKFQTQFGDKEFARWDNEKKWSKILIAHLGKTVPIALEESGKYIDGAVQKQVSILTEMLQYFSSDREKIAKIHTLLANLKYDPNNQEAFNFHYQAALTATPEWGEGYIEWASVFESEQSSKLRREAITILEKGLQQPFFDEGERLRIQILEKLIHRCMKERITENVDRYKLQLKELLSLKLK